MKFKKVFSIVMCAVMALSLAACGNNKPTNSSDGGDRSPNPFTEYQTLEEAEKEAKFTLNLPQSIAGYSDPMYRLDKEDGLLEVVFENGEESITFRKAGGDGDISGNYSNFSEKNEVELDGTVVTMKGADGKVNVAVWSKDDYSYSIDSTEAMDKTAMTDLIKTVNNDDNAPIGGDPATWGPDNQPSDNGVQPPSPFKPCDTLDAAEEMAGFDLTLPKTADMLEAIENEMIQAFYGEDGTDMLIRKALGSEDISGDYNAYAQTETVDGVTLKGADGQFSLAMWTDGDYTYSISVGSALSQTDMMALVGGVK